MVLNLSQDSKGIWNKESSFIARKIKLEEMYENYFL